MAQVTGNSMHGPPGSIINRLANQLLIFFAILGFGGSASELGRENQVLISWLYFLPLGTSEAASFAIF